jgi:hypothetical protein
MLRAFVLMPFASEFDEVYKQVIRQPLIAAGFEVSRADEVQGARSIMQDVMSGIHSADLIIADLTGGNTNVFYELGIAHALGKNVVLITQDLEEVPFDLRAYRVVTYSTHFARVEEAKAQLERLARGAKEGAVQFGSPVSDFARSSAPTLLARRLTSTDPSSTASLSSDDYGMLDAFADVQDGLNAASSVISEVGSRLEILTPQINSAGERLSGPLRENPSEMREVIRALASEMDAFTRWLRESNSKYREGLIKLSSGLDAMFADDVTRDEQALSKLPEFINAISAIEAPAVAGRVNLLRLSETAASLPKIERDFNRAKVGFSEETRSLAENIEQTIALFSRVRTVGGQLIGIK